MLGLVYFFSYILEHMDLMIKWLDIKVEMVSVRMCNLCSEGCESVGHFLWDCPAYFECRVLFLEDFRGNFE